MKKENDSNNTEREEETIIVSEREGAGEDVTFEPETDADMVGSKSSFGGGGEDSQVKKLTIKLKEAQEKAKENLDGWQRLKADTANAKQAEFAKIERAKARGVEGVLESVLPALDSFDSAMQGAGWESIDEAWRMGMEFVQSQLLSGLAEHGVTSFGTIGDELDTMLHDLAEGSDENGTTLKKVLRKGYKNKDSVIRAAKVIV